MLSLNQVKKKAISWEASSRLIKCIRDLCPLVMVTFSWGGGMDATLEAVNILVSVSCKVHTFKGLVQFGIKKKNNNTKSDRQRHIKKVLKTDSASVYLGVTYEEVLTSSAQSSVPHSS